MQVLVYPDPASVAQAAAEHIERRARDCLAARPRFSLAVSGGRTPWAMLHEFAQRDLDWDRVHVFQVDERVAAADDPDRNWTQLQKSLSPRWAQIGQQVHPMPVESSDLEMAAAEYASRLVRIAGDPSRLDLIHLGLGEDGHTASLTPKDPALGVRDRDVTVTLPYQGRTRMTLTFSAINRARHVLWVVTGASKHHALIQLLNGDTSIPASHVSDNDATVIADAAAVGSSPH